MGVPLIARAYPVMQTCARGGDGYGLMFCGRTGGERKDAIAQAAAADFGGVRLQAGGNEVGALRFIADA